MGGGGGEVSTTHGVDYVQVPRSAMTPLHYTLPSGTRPSRGEVVLVSGGGEVVLVAILVMRQAGTNVSNCEEPARLRSRLGTNQVHLGEIRCNFEFIYMKINS